MIIAIHQPDYIPYLGYFYKMSKSDEFVFLDDCQFSNDNMHHWNKIKTPQGECRLKISVEQHLGMKINEIRTRDELKWKERHLKTIEMNYAKAPYFKTFFPIFQELLLEKYVNLAEMNITLNTWIADQFGFHVKLHRSSAMHLDTVNEERVINICTLLHGDTYISGNGAKAYQKDSHFTSQGVALRYTDYQPVTYKQQWTKQCPFLQNMSVLDYIFNCGFDWDTVITQVLESNNGNRQLY